MMPESAVERRLAAILAADVVGYSRLMAADESGTHARLKAARVDLVEPAVQQHGGRIVKLMGDGVLIEFPSVVGAIECAVVIQNALEARERELPADRRIRLRIGINLGDIIHDDGDIYGDGVNVAARLEALAEPGGILVSGGVHDHLRGKTRLAFEPLGPQRLKNIPEPVAVHRVAGIVDAERPKGFRMPGRRLAPALALVLALVVAAAGAGLWWHSDRPSPADDAGRPSIAVLPFASLDPEEAYFADGLSGDLITDLARIAGLLVVGRSAVAAYEDSALDRGELARRLGVRYLVEGDVRRVADRLRVNVQLTDTQTGDHLWAERFERGTADVFAVQDEIRRRIVEALSVRLSPAEAARLSRLPTTDLEAYDVYLRAGQAARAGTAAGLQQALALYERAEVLDPGFAEAFSADARAAAFVARNGFDEVLNAPVARQRAYRQAGRALELDPDAPGPFAVLAALQLIDGRHDDALASAERAVALGPSDADAHAAQALVLTFAGRFEEAMAAIELTLRLYPQLVVGDPIGGSLAFIVGGRFDRAIELLEAARLEARRSDDLLSLLGAAYERAGRPADARAATAAALQATPYWNVEIYRILLAHLRPAKALEGLLETLREAGLPQWRFGFDPATGEPLAAAAIRALAFGRVWQGELEGAGPAIAAFEPDGRMAFRTVGTIATGRAFVRGDQLCELSEGLMLGRPICGPVVRQPVSTTTNGTEYSYVNATKLLRFAVVD
jgi:class 3 adenylate cyclase/TolB-like protein